MFIDSTVPSARVAALCGTAGLLVCPLLASSQATVSFPTDDGGIVYASEYGSSQHAVLLAHGGQFAKESWAEQAVVLENAGLRVLAIDFRGRGLSRGGGAAATDDDAAHLDVLAALRYLDDSGAERISIVGASFGGWAAATAATQLPAGTVDRLVLLAHSPIPNPEALSGRKLFIIARNDFQGRGFLRLPAMQDQYDRAPDPKRLLLFEGSAHAQHLFATDQGPRLMREILDFLVEP